MLVSVAAVLVASSVGQVGTFTATGAGYDRPIAMHPPYPEGHADDVRRPGFNGRLWVSRPIIGGIQQGPYPLAMGSPGPEAYGEYDNPHVRVPARVGHLVVGISPWDSIEERGLTRLEHARNFWLEEQGYVGGVRTFVNDLYLWDQADGNQAMEVGDAGEAAEPGVPMPRATITLPADMPRQRRRLRVDAGAAGPAMAHAGGAVRISWPMSAPAEVVMRSAKEVEAERAVASAK